MKRYFLFVLIIVGIVSCKNNERQMSRDISIPVSVEEVKKGIIEQYLSITGSVTPEKEAIKKTEIAGLYQLATNPRTNKPFAPGDKVQKGEIVVSLINDEYKSGLQISSKELQLKINKNNYKKQGSLYEKGGVTKTEYQNAEVNMINSEYSLADAKINLDKMNVRAPFSGVLVTIPYHTVNTLIDAGQEVFKIMDYSNLMMEVNLAEKNINNITKNQSVRVTNYTLPDDTLIGNITQISPVIDPETRSFKAMVSIKNEKLLLRPGMFAKGDIILKSKKDVIVIPKNIVLSRQHGYTVYVENKGYAFGKRVTFGLENPEYAEITEGLKEGDRVVTKGFETLRRRSKVKVIK